MEKVAQEIHAPSALLPTVSNPMQRASRASSTQARVSMALLCATMGGYLGCQTRGSENVPHNEASFCNDEHVAQALERANGFLLQQIDEGTFGLGCVHSGLIACPLHETGQAFTAYFLASALAEQFPAAARSAILLQLQNEERDGLWAYALQAPVDADDTAFVLRVKRMWGNPASSRPLGRFQGPDGFFRTFALDDLQHRPIVSLPSEQNNAFIHAEVHANALPLSLPSSRNNAISSLLVSRQPDGNWPGYFYSSAYSTWMHVLALRELQATPSVLSISCRWLMDVASEASADPTTIAFALDADSFCGSNDPRRGELLQRLTRMQQQDGSFRSESPVWHFVLADSPATHWYAHDIHGVFTTAVASLALQCRPDVSHFR